jgi:selenide,water dikinase
MGGTPLNALSFVAWPVEGIGLDALTRVLGGAAAVCREAGIEISGGHSIVDDEPKFGLFVTGTIHPARIVSNAGARPGDALVLTKPIGTGILTTAAKRGALDLMGLADAVASMVTLNRGAAQAMTAIGVHAATDVTGFGLLGHLGNVLRASSRVFGRSLGARLAWKDVPVFDNVTRYLHDGLCPSGTRRNLAFAAPFIRFPDGMSEPEKLLLADAQTSGGLLIAVPPDRLPALLQKLTENRTLAQAVVGTVVEADRAGEIHVV